MLKPAFFAPIAYLAMIFGLHIFESAWLAFAIYHGLILIVMLGKGDRKYWRELFAGWDWKFGLGAVVFGLGGGLVLYFLAPYAGVDSGLIQPVLNRLGLTGKAWLIFVFYHSLVNPFFEEAFWRGKLGSNSRRLILNDLFFAGYHLLVLLLFLDWPFLVLAFVVLVLAGWLWRQLRVRCGGLAVPVVSHMAADGSIMLVTLILSLREIA
ncbi:MAG: CPBP family intramembrane metalloprotease [bacterium]|nr:CPBP family intramembrane metalloprotease [bacterium]